MKTSIFTSHPLHEAALNLALRGYQTAGTSKTGTVPAWHLFSLSKISAIEVTQSCFEGVRPFYNPVDTAMLRIDAHVWLAHRNHTGLPDKQARYALRNRSHGLLPSSFNKLLFPFIGLRGMIDQCSPAHPFNQTTEKFNV